MYLFGIKSLLNFHLLITIKLLKATRHEVSRSFKKHLFLHVALDFNNQNVQKKLEENELSK